MLVRQQLFSTSTINTKVKNQNLVRNTDLSKNTSFHKQGTEAENVDVFTVSVTIVELQIKIGCQSPFLYATKQKKKNQF